MGRRFFAALLGNARLWRAGERILRSRTFKRLFRQNAETSTLQACAPQTVRFALIVFFISTAAFADESGKFDWFKPLSTWTGEYSAEETYVSDATVSRGNREIKNFDESDTILRFVATPRIKLGVLRIGLEWEYFSFDFPAHTPLPGAFQELSAVIGLDTQISESILARVQFQPGYYGTNNFDSDQMNVPFIVGGTYIYNPSLQFVFGISVDVERDYPVIPAAGVRWKFYRQWVANLVLPTPRIEYEAAKGVTIYLGGNIKQTNFRVDNDFGDTHGDRRLNHAVLTYSEVRVGPGVDWKISPEITLTAEAGYQPYRSFDFYRADVRFEEDGSAPYGMLSVHGAF